jgi:hypothetical protein
VVVALLTTYTPFSFVILILDAYTVPTLTGIEYTLPLELPVTVILAFPCAIPVTVINVAALELLATVI